MISTIMQESKYIADTVEQKYVVESGKAFKVGVFWACSRDLARDIPNNRQEISKKTQKVMKTFQQKYSLFANPFLLICCYFIEWFYLFVIIIAQGV